MNRFTVFILGLLACAITHSNAQDQTIPEPEKRMNHSVGAGAGFTTGYGLSYRYKPGKLGGQINFAPYHSSETDRYSIGATLLYTLIENKISNLYLYQGNHYYYNSETVYTYDPYTGAQQATNERNTDAFFNNGLGFGIEFIILKRVGFNLMGGYAFYRNFSQVNVTGETALYYKF